MKMRTSLLAGIATIALLGSPAFAQVNPRPYAPAYHHHQVRHHARHHARGTSQESTPAERAETEHLNEAQLQKAQAAQAALQQWKVANNVKASFDRTPSENNPPSETSPTPSQSSPPPSEGNSPQN